MREYHEKWKDTWFQAIGQVVDLEQGSYSDFILHFDIWRVDEDRLRDCFSVFPRGVDMLSRAKIAREIEPVIVRTEDDVLLEHLSETNLRLQAVFDMTGLENPALQEESCPARSVYRGDEDLRVKLLTYAEAPTVFLDDILGKLFEKYLGKEGYAAYHFLREPFYQIYTSYSVANWIFWAALEDEFGIDPYAPDFELYKIRAQSGWGEEETFVYQFDSMT